MLRFQAKLVPPSSRSSSSFFDASNHAGWSWLALAALAACSADGGDSRGDTTPLVEGGAGSSTNQNGSTNGVASGGSAPSGVSGGSANLDGGAAGDGEAGGGAGSTSESSCARADILCLTFDDLAAGSMPQTPPFLKYDCNGRGTSVDLLVEDGRGTNGSKGFTSKKSVDSGCNLLADLGTHEELWVTADVQFSAGVPVGTVHELTPFEITKTAADDPGIRPGIRADNSCNSWPGAELNITGAEERTGCTAFKFSTDEWYCLEVQVKNQRTAVEGHLYINGTEPTYHIHQDAVTSVTNENWTGARTLRLGARSYSSSVESPLYIDNLSVSTTRVGCTKA